MSRSFGNFHIKFSFISVLIIALSDCKVLDDYIQHYEELHYDSDAVHQTHVRNKRSASHVLTLPLEAFGRKLHLELKKDSGVFTDNHKMELSNGSLVDVDLSFLYSGTVKGIPGSHCHGSILQGIFQGSIHLPDETYHVEKSNRFFNDAPVFHSVIYRESDINLDPFKERRSRERREARDVGSCGYDRAVEWMKEVKMSEVVQTAGRPVRSTMEWQEIHTGKHNKYVASLNESPERRKREIKNLGANNTCTLSLRSDPEFWDRYMEKAGRNEKLAKDEILAFFNSHVQALNRIYGATVFKTYDGNLGYQAVQFAVQRTRVMTRQDDCGTTSTQESKFCRSNIDVSNFLNLNSLENHDLFCLAYVFTYRDFTQGTLGLAWVGASDSSSGGICEKYKTFRENGLNIEKSLNTGIVTTINYGKEVPSKVSQLTFSHEVGHNFGSPHDSGSECAPYGTSRSDAGEGNYLMFASATAGDKTHNSQFSPCSKDNITRVLDAVINQRFGKSNCFIAKGSFCGNGLVEEGEECDCGFVDECQDKCCNPKKEGTASDPTQCKLKTSNNVVCSPSQGPCCNPDTCTHVSAAEEVVCRYAQDCAEESICNGASAVCPDPVKKPNGTYCNKYGFTCKDGECAGSLCERMNGWTECFITGATDNKEEQLKLCRLACQAPNNTDPAQTCILSSDDEKLQSYPQYRQMIEEVRANRSAEGIVDQSPSGITLAAGSPCNNYQGYCDVFYRCRGVDAEGPLTRLKNLIFNPATLQTISDWIVEHWWAVLLMAIGLVIAMGLFIKFCAVHTPSSNPKAKPARKLTDTLRRRRHQHTSHSQPQQVRYPQYQYDRREYYDVRGPRHQYDRPSYESNMWQQQQQQELLPDPKYPVKSPQGPPPPYSGSSHPSSSAGPPHGHGKKGRKQRDLEMGKV